MARTIVSGATLGLCKRATATTSTHHLATAQCHRIAVASMPCAKTSAMATTTARSVSTRLLSTFALQRHHPLSQLSPQLMSTTATRTFANSPFSLSSNADTTDKDGSLHRYTQLSTPSEIASTHFDLSHIPPSEHAQILHDFILVPDYLTPEEHDMMVKGATLKLKRALGKQVRYEDGHFDGVITRYRECSAGDWSSPFSATTSPSPDPSSNNDNKERTTPREMMDAIKSDFFPSTWTWVSPHILELEAGQGGIKPHVDHLDASGSVVAGLCLGSSAVMELIHQDDPQKWFRVLLPNRSFYFQRDSVRYSYKHGIPIEPEDHQFRGKIVPKEKRISVMLRNALDPSLHSNRPSTMY
ncbi:Alpha-ketoglutarate-dependent dioxygenase alkB 7, mitochondrial [Mortierella sp. GBA39]|nr:Alpha-ketoglutarate-dependent dioxygenase alkB 7, mitochondrial [Mortierella sp. GBA39]